MIEFIVYDMSDNKKQVFSIITKVALVEIGLTISHNEILSATGWESYQYTSIKKFLEDVDNDLKNYNYYNECNTEIEEYIQKEIDLLLLFMKEVKEKYNEDKYKVIYYWG